MAEAVVADQAAIWLSTELTELLFIDLLEERALVPGGVRIQPQVPVELVLRDVHDPDLEQGVGFGLEHQIFHAAPGALKLLEFRRVHDFVHLRRKLLVQLRNHLPDGVEHVGFDDAGIGECLLDQCLDGVLDFRRRAFGARPKGLFQERSKLVRILGLRSRFLLDCFGCHDKLSIMLYPIR